MRRTDFLYVPKLGWEQWAYLLVIPAMVYFVAAQEQKYPAREGTRPSSAASVAAAPLHGTTKRGDYFVCQRTRLVEFCTLIPLPETL